VGAEQRRNTESEGRIFRRARLRASPEQRDAIYKAILDSSHIDTEYVALLTLAGLIALFGLLENSAAVIIGAMLISPLMNPILSAALALLLGDGKLGKRSAIVLVVSITGVIGITWLVASLTPLKQATPEILARTAPNLLDLFIAVLSGLAGTLALRNSSVAMTILPGVAIAVAVIPPLSVVGYGLSAHQPSTEGGAFLLFVTNLVAIIISAAVVFRTMGFRPHRETEQGRWKLKYRAGISVAVLLVLSVPLFLTLRKAAIHVTTQAELQRDLDMAFESNKASISDLSFSSAQDGLIVHATLRTPRYVETNAIQAATEALQRQFGSGTTLLIDQILITQGGVASEPASAQNPISAGVVKTVEQPAPFDFKQSRLKTLELVQSDVDAVLAGTGIQREAPPEIVLASTTPLALRLQLASAEPLNSQTISLLASQLGSRLGLPVELHGEVGLRAPSFQLTLAPAKPNQGLSPGDHAALQNLIQRAQQDDLRLEIRYAPDQAGSGGKEAPRFVSEMQSLLSRSALKSSQWTIVPSAPAPAAGPAGVPAAGKIAEVAGTNATTPPAMAAAPLYCEVKTFQDF
jgi:uncharacterized hydrophobic protein (TIGR00271 family)